MSNPAEEIINHLGGALVVSKALCALGYEITRTGVAKWYYSKPGGSGGMIPSWWHMPLMHAATHLGKDIKHEHFFNGIKPGDKDHG